MINKIVIIALGGEGKKEHYTCNQALKLFYKNSQKSILILSGNKKEMSIMEETIIKLTKGKSKPNLYKCKFSVETAGNLYLANVQIKKQKIKPIEILIVTRKCVKERTAKLAKKMFGKEIKISTVKSGKYDHANEKKNLKMGLALISIYKTVPFSVTLLKYIIPLFIKIKKIYNSFTNLLTQQSP